MPPEPETGCTINIQGPLQETTSWPCAWATYQGLKLSPAPSIGFSLAGYLQSSPSLVPTSVSGTKHRAYCVHLSRILGSRYKRMRRGGSSLTKREVVIALIPRTNISFRRACPMIGNVRKTGYMHKARLQQGQLFFKEKQEKFAEKWP